jgi:predicted phage tail protein
MAAEPQARQAGSIRPADWRATIDVCLTASAVLVTGSEWRSTAWLGAAAAAGLCALVALVR